MDIISSSQKLEKDFGVLALSTENAVQFDNIFRCESCVVALSDYDQYENILVFLVSFCMTPFVENGIHHFPNIHVQLSTFKNTFITTEMKAFIRGFSTWVVLDYSQMSALHNHQNSTVTATNSCI